MTRGLVRPSRSRVCTSAPVGPVGLKAAARARRPSAAVLRPATRIGASGFGRIRSCAAAQMRLDPDDCFVALRSSARELSGGKSDRQLVGAFRVEQDGGCIWSQVRCASEAGLAASPDLVDRSCESQDRRLMPARLWGRRVYLGHAILQMGARLYSVDGCGEGSWSGQPLKETIDAHRSFTSRFDADGRSARRLRPVIASCACWSSMTIPRSVPGCCNCWRSSRTSSSSMRSGRAEAAMSLAEREPIDVAVVDYQLGSRSGLWLSRMLKRLEPGAAGRDLFGVLRRSAIGGVRRG